jgi:TonB family protein
LEKTLPTYPSAALKAGIQGLVVLRIAIDTSGAVQVLKVVSGDPGLAKAASEAVRQWKYKPYQGETNPIEVETLVTVNFRFQNRQPPEPPPLGTFEGDAYSNEHFSLYYPLSRDWVRETELLRKRYASGKVVGAWILLAEVHIPQDNTELRADAFFTLVAVRRPQESSSDACKHSLDLLATNLQSNKEGKQKGETNQYAIAGRDFYRADFEYSRDPRDRTMICSPAKDFLLMWNIEGLSRKAVDTAAATLNSITWPAPPPAPVAASPSMPPPAHVDVGMTTGLLIKKVTPVYPPMARNNYIQGTVLMRAEISKAGDVVDLEVLDGPIELAVSAVNAVRLWKYKPYRLNGEPVQVITEIRVNYTLTR